MFLPIALALCALAVASVLWPFLKPTPQKTLVVRDHAAIVRELYRSRAKEVAQEVAYETNDPELFAELRDELGLVYLSEQFAAESDTSSASKRGWLYLLAALVPILSLALYFQISDPSLLDLRGAQRVLMATEGDPELQAWQSRLQSRVQKVPGDDQSWYLLGRTYLKLDQFAEAADAFAMADQLAGEQLDVLLYWLQARYLNSRGLLDEFSRTLADKLLQAHPDFPIVLEMLALDAFRREDFGTAIGFLHRAVSSTSDPAQQQVFAIAIDQVRANMAVVPPGVTVAVAAMTKVPAGATVFVIARPVGGGLPYAVAERPALSVPFTVRLDDLVAMQETSPLSGAEEFEVLVRLSLTGSVMSQPGEWVWQSDVLSRLGEEIPVIQARIMP